VKKSKTPTFLLELPLSVDVGQAKRLHAHFEAARCLYNALLGEARKRSPNYGRHMISLNMPCISLSRRPIVPGLLTTLIL
jgi:hypothetical protein